MAVTKIVAADVETWLINSDAVGDFDADLVGQIIDAVYAYGERHWSLDDAGDDTDDERDQALTMEAARLYQRKYSSNGYVGADDLTPVRVMQFDPDVRRMLAGRLITVGLFGPSENT